MPIKLTDELVPKTKKGKIASAKNVFLEGDEKNLQQVGEQTEQLKELVDAITVSGGASVATAVTYDNSKSGMTAVTAQGAVDELAAKNKSQDTAIDTKASKKDVNESLDKKVDKSSIQQVLGDNEDMVPSLKLVKDKLAEKVDSSDYDEKVKDIEDSLATKAATDDVNTELAKKFDKANIAQELSAGDNADASETEAEDSTQETVSDEEKVPSLKLMKECLDTKSDSTTTTEELDKKFDKENISSELGEDDGKVPSLKLAKDELGKKFDKANVETGESLTEDDTKVPSSKLVKAVTDATNSNVSDLKDKVEKLPMQKVVHMTQAEYEALEDKDDDTYYMCTEE